MTGVDSHRLSRAARDLGDAVLDPSAWPRIMDEISAAAGAIGAALLQSDVRTPDIPRTASVDDCFTHYFATGWHTRDIRAERSVPLLLRDRAVVSDQDILTVEEMNRSDYYNEIVTRFGLQWFAAVGFKAGPALWALVLQRTPQQGPFEAEEKRALAGLAARLSETASLSRLVGYAALTGASSALHRLGIATLTLDRCGRVLDANGSAEAIFDDDIYVHDRCLMLRDRRARASMDAFLLQLRTASDTATLAMPPIVLKRSAKTPVVIRALPVDPAARSPFGGARTLLTFSPMDVKPVPDTELIADVFALTRAEAEVASLAAQGKSPAAIAASRGISIVTVRNQLRTIYAKTGTHRQGELIALLSRL